MGIGLEVQDMQDLYLVPGKALFDRLYCLFGMLGLVDSQQDFHYSQYFWLLGFPEGRL